ncbi:sigma factor binding protein 2, chloroplastic-like [Argentina anserina]|uniref:sigma factor binding protein 2, chloroplastic-like n=1 Tax=Argentina anserina TaxID=57926 RepID=UPI0021765AB9|nr:sigma factor binding protein 2, chloroplastic-like [Potentilla anserina]
MDDTISNVVCITACNSSGQLKNQTQTKTKTRSKSKKKPIKVVYISNPMKVTTSASEFRALVQQLTGQDADDLPNLHPTANPKVPVEISSSRQLPEISNSKTTCTQYYDDHDEIHQHLYADVDGLFEPEMLDSFKGFL